MRKLLEMGGFVDYWTTLWGGLTGTIVGAIMGVIAASPFMRVSRGFDIFGYAFGLFGGALLGLGAGCWLALRLRYRAAIRTAVMLVIFTLGIRYLILSILEWLELYSSNESVIALVGGFLVAVILSRSLARASLTFQNKK